MAYNGAHTGAQIDAAITGMNSGVIGFPTKALMDADLDHDDAQLADVTNDSSPENNGRYRKYGASGTGSWIASGSVGRRPTGSVAGLTALRGITGGFSGEIVYLEYRSIPDDGGEGNFLWDGTDLSTEVAVDTQGWVYVAPTSDLTGASGAWVRQNVQSGHLSVGLLEAQMAFAALDRPVSGETYVGITGYGDSMASVTGKFISDIAIALMSRYGVGAVFTPGFGYSWLGAEWTFAGGASQPMTDYTYFPGANQVVMPDGSTAETTTGNFFTSSAVKASGQYPDEYGFAKLKGFRRVTFYYLTRPGDGDLTFEVSQTNVTGYSPEVVDCDATLSLQSVDIDVIDPIGSVTVNIAASGGACIFVGAAFWRDYGVLAWSSQVGGATMDDQNTYITNGNVSGVYNDLATALHTKLAIHAQRCLDSTAWQDKYDTVFDAIAALGISQLITGEPPYGNSAYDTRIAVVNSYLYQQARIRGLAFFDVAHAFGKSGADLVTDGWLDADGTHLAPPGNRFISSRVLDFVNWFRNASNRFDTAPITLNRLAQERTGLLAFDAIKGRHVAADANSALDASTSSGGFSYSPTFEKGWQLIGAAALGYISGRVACIPAGIYVAPHYLDMVFVMTGYRNLALTAGTRGFVIFGAQSPPASLSAITDKCFGVEIALGSDVGSPDGFTDEMMRLFYRDDVGITYGRWVQTNQRYIDTANNGFNFYVHWDNSLGVFTLARGGFKNQIVAVSSLSAPYFQTAGCSGQWAIIGLVAEDSENVPASASVMSFQELTARWRLPGLEETFGYVDTQ